MRLLAPGNTEFARSTGLPIPGNFRSGRLKRLLNALVQYQNAHNLTNLQDVVQAVSLWRRHNPKEVMLRGKKLKQLEAELESSRQLYNQVDRNRNALAGMRQEQTFQAAQGPGRATWAADVQATGDALALDIRRAEQRLHARGAIDLGGADDHVVVNDAILHQKFPVLKQIEITDIPIGGRGRYRHTEMDDATQVDRNQALTMLGRGHHNPELDPKFWLNLGKLVTTPRQGRYFGRCLSCAAAVIKTLIEDPVYDDLMIEKIASPEADHHLVLLGRENADGLSMNRLAQRGGWGEAVILDVWQGNLNGSFKYVYSEANCKYVHNKRLKFYCVFPPHKRAEHRAHLASVAALRGRNVPRVMDAILTRRAQEQNAETQAYRKVTTGGVTRWVPA